MDDRQLLAHFAAESSAESFAELARRYSPMVYAAARRQVRDEHLAEDVTQAVFLLLSQKAPSIRSPLAGWLLTTTRLTALNAMKLERRRAHHEQDAARMRSEQTQPGKEASWDEYVSVLDTAIQKLSAGERHCIAMRFLRGLSLDEIASALKISPVAAQKRVNRSLMRLRRNIMTSAAVPSLAALGEQLTANGSTLPPAPLAAKIAATISLGRPGGVHALAGKTLSTIKLAQVKVAATILAAIAVIAGGTKLMVDHAAATRTATAPVPVATTLPNPPLFSIPPATPPVINSPQTFITLSATDMDAREALRQISRQAGVKTELSPPNLWSEDGGHVYHVTLHLVRATFWSAMAELCGQTLSIPHETQDPHTIQIGDSGAQSNHQLGGVMYASGPFTLVATELSRDRSVEFADNQPAKNDSIQLSIFIDPATRLFRFGTPVLTVAQDDMGRSLLAPDTQSSTDQLDNGMPWNTSNCTWLQRQSCAMQINSPIGRRISILRGFFKAEIELESTELTIRNIAAADGQSATKAGRTIAIRSSKFSGTGGSVDYNVSIDPATQVDDAELLREATDDISFVDVGGVSLSAIAIGNVSGGQGSFHSDLTSTQSIHEPVDLKWKIATRIQTMNVPFEFRDLPLPPN